MCNAYPLHPHFSEEGGPFIEKLLAVMNNGALSLMLSIGHRTGLFDTMDAMTSSATSAEIAEEAGLNERYVREWLGAMVVGGIVVREQRANTYMLPAEHARYLTRTAGRDNLGTLAQYIPLLGAVEDSIVACFKNGGGVPYSAYPRFQEVMAEDSGQSVLPALFDSILPLIPDGLARLERGAAVLDLGCGKARALLAMAERFPKSSFTGYDISPEAIDAARGEARQLKLHNIQLAIHDAAAVQEEDTYDIVFTFDAIHDQAQPQRVLENIYRALRPRGTYLMQDIDASSEVMNNVDHPIGPLIYTISCMHCMPVSLANGGAGLGAAWGVELAEKMLHEAGFGKVEIRRLPHDIQNCYYITSK